ncbi:lppc lipoprotein [Stenotrophomonas ginsengisoli]|uniref:Lppc lipoprotein n=1 Tax=Stenotrophomonas ginsengisoli TaxID=336566 RepID=A0A0R0D1I0_9GAMM|nr:penicillin-binding protein activator [Stenotrophomonas ginsengisoli]KRG76029.1 lppc lipoprotein [Stenotrophomonas ginsengisoli]
MKNATLRLSALSISLALLAGCATTATTPSASPAQSAALAQLDGGQPREAAIALETLAGSLRGAARNQTLADAAWGWHLAGDSARAQSLLTQVNPRQLAGASQQRYQLLQAIAALAANQPAQALSLLASPQAVHAPLQAPWLQTSAAAQEAQGDLFAAAASLHRALPLLSGAARDTAQADIQRLLARVDDTTLRNRSAALAADDSFYNLAGRALIARGLSLPRPLQLDPASLPDFSQRAAAERDGYRPPAHIAVLLPLSGQLATAAGPVRDGLLAGYYAEHRRRPELQFIDTAGTAAGALSAYDKAVAAGADYVIGPLGRDEVDALFARSQLPVPVQALNHGRTLPPAGHLAFSLAPEDDGLMAAEYLLARERRNVAVIHSSDDNGRRAAAAFANQFKQRGGQVAASIAVSDSPTNIGSQLPAGVDGVFLAVRGPQARALAPQLALAGLGGATRVGSSQLTSGTGKAEEDQALDGIAFPTERWASHGVAGLPAASELAGRLPTARGGAARLLAFGFDAWKISAYLPHLATSTDQGLPAATGLLYLDGSGQVLRRPSWSTFSGGHSQPIMDGR